MSPEPMIKLTNTHVNNLSYLLVIRSKKIDVIIIFTICSSTSRGIFHISRAILAQSFLHSWEAWGGGGNLRSTTIRSV